MPAILLVRKSIIPMAEQQSDQPVIKLRRTTKLFATQARNVMQQDYTTMVIDITNHGWADG